MYECIGSIFSSLSSLFYSFAIRISLSFLMRMPKIFHQHPIVTTTQEMTVQANRKRLSTGLTVTSKVFVRSRNGGALKIVREHYLRNDIPCYSSACTHCQEIVKPDANGNLPRFILSANPAKTTDGKPHYVILDTNIVLHAMILAFE